MDQKEIDHLKYVLNYNEKHLDLLTELSRALEDKDFDQAKLLDSRIRKLNVDREIHFKKEHIEIYKKRLEIKD